MRFVTADIQVSIRAECQAVGVVQAFGSKNAHERAGLPVVPSHTVVPWNRAAIASIQISVRAKKQSFGRVDCAAVGGDEIVQVGPGHAVKAFHGTGVVTKSVQVAVWPKGDADRAVQTMADRKISQEGSCR